MKLPLIIKNLQSTTSHIEKIKIMRDNQHALIMPLYYCYSPFCRFHIRQIPKELKGRGIAMIDVAFYSLLSRLIKREITGDEARKTLFNFIETLHPTYAVLAIQIVKKRLDIGCNAGLINRAFRGELIEVHKVMLAQRYKATRALEFPLYVSPKIDGVRAVYRKGSFYTRNGHEILGLDHLKTIIEFQGIRETLDGELYILNCSCDITSGIIRSNAVEKLQVSYAVFDLPDQNLPLGYRISLLRRHFPELGRGFDVEHVPHLLVSNLDQVNLAYRKYRLAGLEGLMLKNPDAFYQGKRSWDWQKMKPLHDAEYKIFSVFEGEGKYEGMLGGFIVCVGAKAVRVGSGFSDKEREDIWKNPEHYVGRWATIEAMEKTATGKLRHPIYKGVRWDI